MYVSFFFTPFEQLNRVQTNFYVGLLSGHLCPSFVDYMCSPDCGPDIQAQQADIYLYFLKIKDFWNV